MAAFTDSGIERHAQFLVWAICQFTRSVSEAFFGILCCTCQDLFIISTYPFGDLLVIGKRIVNPLQAPFCVDVGYFS